MLGKLRTYFKEGFSYSALEISDAADGQTYSLLSLKKTKGELVITDTKELKALDELSGTLKKTTPLFVCINTSNVLIKKVESATGPNQDSIVNQAFPNLDLNNFYYEVVPQSESTFVAISKKEVVDAILERLKQLKIKISRFTLGISAIQNVLPYLEEETISTSSQQITTNNKEIETFENSKPETEINYTVNGLQLSSSNLLSFSQILGHLGGSPYRTNFEDVVEGLKWEFKNHRIFNQVLKYALAVFVVLLLSNFFIYNFYHEKVGELNATMAATSSKKDELTVLDASVERKQERVETLSSASNSKATFYLDLLAQNIPNSILLSEIKYQPLAKPVRESKPILLEEDMLLISGISKDVNEFSFWVEELEKLDWIESVETLDYDFISKNTSNFLIEIGFHEN